MIINSALVKGVCTCTTVPATHDDMVSGKLAALGYAASTTIQNETSLDAQ